MNNNKTIYTVSELTKKIKYVLEDNFFDTWVRGEVSNCKMASSGHIYFTIKDEFALIQAVLFKGYQKNIKFNIEDGINVIVHGNINVFEKRGYYQIIVDFIEPEGIGGLQLAFEQLKEKLMKEGLFDESYKKSIPSFPDAIGVVTSPAGAAIRDILNVITRRYRGIKIIIYPAMVQGEGAAEEIANAIKKANERNEVDVLIVGRGGGSIEDLWPFNEEIVARSIYNSKIPIISAVGHEIDYTISDFVADLRAPTPSAAAEIVVRNKEELIEWFKDITSRLYSSVDRTISDAREKASHYSSDLLIRRMKTMLNEKNLIIDDLTRVLINAMGSNLIRTRGRFEKLIGKLNTLSPLNTLSRGFAIVLRYPDNKPIFSIDEVNKGDDIKTRLKNGEIISTINQTNKYNN